MKRIVQLWRISSNTSSVWWSCLVHWIAIRNWCKNTNLCINSRLEQFSERKIRNVEGFLSTATIKFGVVADSVTEQLIDAGLSAGNGAAGLRWQEGELFEEEAPVSKGKSWGRQTSQFSQHSKKLHYESCNKRRTHLFWFGWRVPTWCPCTSCF